MGCPAGFCPRFFIERELSGTGGAVALGPEDSRHARQVLRMHPGDSCELVTPSGRAYEAEVGAIGEPVIVKPVALLRGVEAGAVYRTHVGLVQAMVRPSAVDLVIEKGTEVGASSFMLVPCAGSGRSDRPAAERLERWRRIAREAAKQSKQTAVPSVEVASSLEDALRRTGGEGTAVVVLQPGASEDLTSVLPAAVRRISLWVGPEGGWTEAELQQLVAEGAAAARLGQGVLRTETAGPVAVAVARLALGDW